MRHQLKGAKSKWKKTVDSICSLSILYYTVLFKLLTVLFHLQTVHCTLYTIHCTQYTVNHSLYTVHFTLYTVNCSVHFIGLWRMQGKGNVCHQRNSVYLNLSSTVLQFINRYSLVLLFCMLLLQILLDSWAPLGRQGWGDRWCWEEKCFEEDDKIGDSIIGRVPRSVYNLLPLPSPPSGWYKDMEILGPLQ